MFAMPVPDEKRAMVLAKHFPKAFASVESFCNHIAKIICTQYHICQWDFIELGSGGFYMVPSVKQNYIVDIPFGRRYSGVVSSDAFGIICCIYTFCFLAEEDERLAYHYIWLTDFYKSHAEFEKIWWAVD